MSSSSPPAPQTLATLLRGVESAQYVGCQPETTYTSLQVDSRAAGPGTVFLASRGLRVDSHRFVPAVLEAGAVAAIVAADHPDSISGPHVRIPFGARPGEIVPRLAANHHGHPADALGLFGLTGTNGKTTCVHLVSSIWSEAGHRHMRLGTTGNWVVDRPETAAYTTPPALELQALLRRTVDRGGRGGVMEVSSHALEQGRVAGLVYDAIGLTSFSQDHLDFHSDMDSYLAAKCRLATLRSPPRSGRLRARRKWDRRSPILGRRR